VAEARCAAPRSPACRQPLLRGLHARPSHTRPMEGRSRAEGRVTSSPSPPSTAKRGQRTTALYLVTPRLVRPRRWRGRSRRHRCRRCRRGLVRLEPSDERTLINRVKAIADAVSASRCALLLDGHPRSWRAPDRRRPSYRVPALTAALDALKLIASPRGGLRSRHDAMLAGEAGADYVMFGEPDRLGGPLPWTR